MEEWGGCLNLLVVRYVMFFSFAQCIRVAMAEMHCCDYCVRFDSKLEISDVKLSGMFRRSALLAIPHRKSLVAIPSVSVVLLEHTSRNVLVSHEFQHEISLL